MSYRAISSLWNREESHWMSHLISDAHFTWYIPAKSLSLPTPRSTGYQSTAARWQKRVFTVTSDNGSHLGSVQHGSKHSRSNYGDKDISLADIFSSKKKMCLCDWVWLWVLADRMETCWLLSVWLLQDFISFSIGKHWQRLKLKYHSITCRWECEPYKNIRRHIHILYSCR